MIKYGGQDGLRMLHMLISNVSHGGVRVLYLETGERLS